MIEVENLTKRFFDVLAVDDISFRVEPGEVVGFLGPNGAGKSTTLKILTCFLPATSGTARLAGFDVLRDSMKVRERIGYLPENVPLYGDMRVKDFLFFRGRLKGLSARETRKRMEETAERCGLQGMMGRLVGQLSKGYRQRVGLADVLLHRPPILLLDEPTGGLDPSQRKEVRELIARLGKDHTILLSSHILAEVESVCSRVLIIKKGRIIADGTPETLVKELEGGERIRVEVSGAPGPVLERLRTFPGGEVAAETVERGDRTEVLVEPRTEEGFQRRLLAHLVEGGVPVESFSTRRLTLEEIFIRLTVEEEVLTGILGPEEGR